MLRLLYLNRIHQKFFGAASESNVPHDFLGDLRPLVAAKSRNYRDKFEGRDSVKDIDWCIEQPGFKEVYTKCAETIVSTQVSTTSFYPTLLNQNQDFYWCWKPEVLLEACRKIERSVFNSKQVRIAPSDDSTAKDVLVARQLEYDNDTWHRKELDIKSSETSEKYHPKDLTAQKIFEKKEKEGKAWAISPSVQSGHHKIPFGKLTHGSIL